MEARPDASAPPKQSAFTDGGDDGGGSPAGIGKHSAAFITCGEVGLPTYYSDHVPFRQ